MSTGTQQPRQTRFSRYPSGAGGAGTLGRRDFLATLLAASAVPGLTRAEVPRGDVDVVIVGAGAAGLAAAHELIGRGVSVTVLEASARIGGRAWTDTRTLGIAFDRGCSWLHAANRNPFTKMARRWGYETLGHDNADEIIYVGDRRATGAEMSAYHNAVGGLERALLGAGGRGRDVSMASVSPRGAPWAGTAEAWLGPLDMGVDGADFSTLDWYRMDDLAPNRMVRAGFGTLIARFGQDLPVRTGVPVTRIRWGEAGGVAVESAAGTVRARACILTPSTGVLASGTIRFDPPLPGWKTEAIANVPMGLLAKIVLRYDGDHFGLPDNSWLAYQSAADEACYFLCWPFGENLMIGFVGGRFAWQLTRAGEAAAVSFARRQLRRMLGASADRRFVAGTFTRWGDNPWTRGGYASARPGHADARAALSRSLEGRLYFAGEACAGGLAQTCGGAFLNGQSVARQVAAKL